MRVVDGDPETGRGGRPHSSGQVRGADAKRAGERKVGTEHYGFMHNVEVWRWVKKEGGESGGEVSAGGDIMALCIMSKCCRSWVVEREVGAGTSF